MLLSRRLSGSQLRRDKGFPKQKTGKFHGIFPSSPRKIPLTFPGFMGCFDVDIAFVDVDLDKASKSMFCAIDTGLIE